MKFLKVHTFLNDVLLSQSINIYSNERYYAIIYVVKSANFYIKGEKSMEREELLGHINECAGIMNQLKQKEDEYNILNEALNKKWNPTKNMNGLGKIIFYLVVFSAIGLLSIFSLSILMGFLVAFSSDPIGTIPYLLFGIAILAIIIFIASSSNKKKNEKRVRMQELDKEMTELSTSPLLSWLPPDYRCTLAYFAIAGYVQNLRANTLQEALNLYETEKHQTRLEIINALK